VVTRRLYDDSQTILPTNLAAIPIRNACLELYFSLWSGGERHLSLSRSSIQAAWFSGIGGMMRKRKNRKVMQLVDKFIH